MRTTLLVSLLVLATCQMCFSQTLSVSAAPFSPASVGVEAGSTFSQPLAAFRFSAAGGSFSLQGFTLTTSGSGNWSTEVSGTNGVEVWRDDGDATFSAATDSMVFQGAGVQPTLVATFASAQPIASGASLDFWVVLNFLASAGGSVPTTFAASIANTSDVNATGAGTIQLGSPSSQSGTLSVVIFFVTSFTPLAGGGQDIVITGSGFTPAVTVTINGYSTGTAQVNASYTQITGLRTGTFGHGPLPIVLTTGLLGPRTLTIVFDGGQSGNAGNRAGCSTASDNATGGAVALAAALTAMCVAVFRQGRRRNWKH